MRIRLLSFFATLAMAASSPVAQAQDDPPEQPSPSPEEEQAQAHFRAGSAHFDRGRYEQALVEFEAAYELSPRPRLLYNLYLTHERLGHLQAAIDHLQRFLPDSADDRPMLQTRLDNLQARLAEQQQAEDAQRESSEQAERERQAEIERLRVSGTTPDEGVPAGAIAGFVAGGAGLVTFGIFAALSMLKNNDLAKSCGEDAGAFCTDDDVASLRTFNLVADIGLGVGVVGAAVGVIFLLTSSSDTEEAPPDVALSPFVGPDGAGLSYRRAF